MQLHDAHRKDLPINAWLIQIDGASSEIHRSMLIRRALPQLLRQKILASIDKIAVDKIAGEITGELINTYELEQLFQVVRDNQFELSIEPAIEILGLERRIKIGSSQYGEFTSTFAGNPGFPVSHGVHPSASLSKRDPSSSLLATTPLSGHSLHADGNAAADQTQGFVPQYVHEKEVEAGSDEPVIIAKVDVTYFPEAWWKDESWVECPWYQLGEDGEKWACALCGKIALTAHINSTDHKRREDEALKTGMWCKKKLPAGFICHPHFQRLTP